MKKAGLVLFDIDGTLTRSENGFIPFNEAFLKTFGFPGDIRTVIPDGNTDPLILDEIFTKAGLSSEIGDERRGSFAANLKESYASAIRGGGTKVTALPGVLQLMEALAKVCGLYRGIVTGNFEATARIKLEAAGLGAYLSLGAFGSDAPDRMDLPRIARERWEEKTGRSLASDRCIIVGDTSRDLEAARKNQMKCVLVGTGRYPVEELSFFEPDACLSDFKDRAAAVETLLRLVER